MVVMLVVLCWMLFGMFCGCVMVSIEVNLSI